MARLSSTRRDDQVTVVLRRDDLVRRLLNRLWKEGLEETIQKWLKCRWVGKRNQVVHFSIYREGGANCLAKAFGADGKHPVMAGSHGFGIRYFAADSNGACAGAEIFLAVVETDTT